MQSTHKTVIIEWKRIRDTSIVAEPSDKRRAALRQKDEKKEEKKAAKAKKTDAVKEDIP